MSLWTPDGERPVQRQPTSSAPGDTPAAPRLSDEQLGELAEMAGVDLSRLTPDQRREVEDQLAAMAVEMAAAQRRLVETPVEDVIANHLAGLYELASLHLAQQPPSFSDAAVAIDALSAVLERLTTKLGENEPTLREMLRVVQTQFVRLKEGSPADESVDLTGSADQ